jgi:hypothetical protein
MVDMRFGHGTWAGIIAERAKRIQEAKEAAAAARREKIQKSIEFEENMKQVLIISAVIGSTIGLFILLFVVLI